MYQTRPDFTQRSSREQLPSLSSLFGSTASHTPRSPFLDSPRDLRHAAAPVHSERPYDASYLHRPPASRYPSYNAAPEQAERSGFQPPPRPAHAAVRPVSPRYDPRYGPAESSRIHSSNSGTSWSPQSQATNLEYPSRDTSSSFRPFPEEVRPQPPPLHRPAPGLMQPYVDGPHNPSITPIYPPTPASTVAGEAAAKEALGPKIWTGTQFLPRFVRQAEVPGEGMCYFYDDGTHCKTVIDGEVVNAHWGVTKAGKPRKRLAIACITCREKKIKCDPDFPRCVQCEKFGRICKFKNAPRGGQGSPETPPTEPEENLQRPLSSRTDGEPFRLDKNVPSHTGSPGQKHRPATPDSELNPAKRQRNGFTAFTPVASESSPLASAHEGPRWSESLSSSTGHHNLLREWQINPYRTHPELVTDLINDFFKLLPETLYRMFPERVFKLWALSAGEKSLDDLMLIYTILAVGTIFSTKAEHKPLGAHYASIARYACENRKYSIQLVQARIFLSLYYYSINNSNDAWDFMGAATRAASGLKLNLEMEKTDEANLTTYPYGLSRNGYAECRRRTFWYCFLLDGFNSFCSGHVSAVNHEDVFLRLPSDTDSFESQSNAVNPFFDPATTPMESMSTKLGFMAYTISVAIIWSDVTANIYRTSQRPTPPGPNAKFIAFYEKTTQRLREWENALPARFRFSTANVERAAAQGKTGAFLRMHSIFHTASMMLNRYVQHSILTPAQVAHHSGLATTHAEAVLHMIDVVIAARRVAVMSFTSPFVGYCIVTAVDIVSRRVRRGEVRELLESFRGARQILDDLAAVWQSTRYQQSLVARRIKDLEEVLSATMGEKGREGEVVEFRDRIQQIWAWEMDCVYQ